MTGDHGPCGFSYTKKLYYVQKTWNKNDSVEATLKCVGVYFTFPTMTVLVSNDKMEHEKGCSVINKATKKGRK